MTKTPFVWLGAGRAKKRGVARSAVLLDKLAKARLPVPQGAILLDELFQIFLSEGVVQRVGDQIVVPDAVWLYEVLYRDVRFPRLKETAVLSLILPDSYSGDLQQPAVRNVDLSDAEALSLGLQRVWSWPLSTDGIRRDVLLLSELEPLSAGIARLNDGADKDAVTFYQRGTDSTLALSRLRRWERPAATASPSMRRLQMLLRGVGRTLGPGVWEIDWIDDGAICWVVGASPSPPSS